MFSTHEHGRYVGELFIFVRLVSISLEISFGRMLYSYGMYCTVYCPLTKLICSKETTSKMIQHSVRVFCWMNTIRISDPGSVAIHSVIIFEPIGQMLEYIHHAEWEHSVVRWCIWKPNAISPAILTLHTSKKRKLLSPHTTWCLKLAWELVIVEKETCEKNTSSAELFALKSRGLGAHPHLALGTRLFCL